jgi:hypothetical protein
MTRYPSHRGDKMSRLAPSSELSDRNSRCGISGLAEGESMAPILPKRLAYFLSKPRLDS